MRQNLDALSTQLYNAVSNWNDFAESETGERILTEAQVSEYAAVAYEHILADMTEMGLV